MSLLICLQQRAFRFPLITSHFRLSFSSGPESFYSSLLEKSTHPIHLTQIHTQLHVRGLQNNGFIITKLINICSNLGEIGYARQLFDEFPDRYVFLWNAIIRGYSNHKMFHQVIEMYVRMQQAFVNPDAFTLPYVIKACGSLEAVAFGRAVHSQVFRLGFEGDMYLQNGMLLFYAKCGENKPARVVFDRLCNRDVISWTTIMSVSVQNGLCMEALKIFRDMRMSNVRPDWISLVTILKAYSESQDLDQGRCVHGLAVKTGYELEPDVRISLTCMYAKCGHLAIARLLFDVIELSDVVLWNAMISGYAKDGQADEALDLFTKMISRNILPDAVTVQSSVLACAQLGSLEQARWMENYVNNCKYKDDIIVRTSLVDMYAKCGCVVSARRVFDSSIEKDVVLWSSMVMGYGLHGQGREAINLFNEMKAAGVRPNEVTFLGLITACSHSGLVDDGWDFFLSMKSYGVEPDRKHYSSIVDLLGRGGQLDKAFAFIMTMPMEPCSQVWGALLSACKIHRHVMLGQYAAEKLFTLDPLYTGHYVQLSNLYASSGRWDGVAKVRELMKFKGLNKDLGCSMIEIDGKLEVFRIGDKSHPRSEEIYRKVEWLETRLLESGFAPDTESSLHDLDEEDREIALCNHSERLAIAYGLIITEAGTVLRIRKNLRACVNCHLATKLISRFVDREIVIRDAKRFHHFKNGNCSCGDYW